MRQLLDNPIWNALTTRQAYFAEIAGAARRFPPEVTSLAAFPEQTQENYDALASLVDPGEDVALFLETFSGSVPGWSLVEVSPLLQMVHEGQEANAPLFEIEELGAADVSEMLALATLTKPGPFGTRTHELGTFLGIRREGKLVAMTGERLRLPGYTEVTAVCTHPDHLGHGYARALVAAVVQQIRARGEVPFLHVRPENARAVELYRRLGFAERATSLLVVLRRA